MRRNFTMLELIVTISIITLILGLVISRAGKTPSLLALKNNIENVKKIFAVARARAIASGNVQTVNYNREQNSFSMDNAGNINARDSQYVLPPEVKVFADGASPDETELSYSFYPDGLVGGYNLKFTTEKHAMSMKISKLTGKITEEEIKAE
ncbi:MAG: pilus assembly FimT family protein [Victivallaceae bacterium]